MAERRHKKGGRAASISSANSDSLSTYSVLGAVLSPEHLRGGKGTWSASRWGRQMVREGDKYKKGTAGFFEVNQEGLQSPEGF